MCSMIGVALLLRQGNLSFEGDHGCTSALTPAFCTSLIKLILVAVNCYITSILSCHTLMSGYITTIQSILKCFLPNHGVISRADIRSLQLLMMAGNCIGEKKVRLGHTGDSATASGRGALAQLLRAGFDPQICMGYYV